MFFRRIKHGIIGGSVGGVVFGMMMAVMGMLPMIGKIVGAPNVVIGFLVKKADDSARNIPSRAV